MAILKAFDFEVPAFGEFALPPFEVPRYQDAVMALNPLAYWRFGDNAGDALADETGTHPLTITGPHTPGQAGAIANDSDTSVFMSGGTARAASPVLPSATNAPFSIAFWIRRPLGAVFNGGFMGQFSGSYLAGELRLHLTANANLRFTQLNQFDFHSVQAIGTAWRFAVLTRSSAGLASWYLDGERDAAQPGAGASIPQNPFEIGTIDPNAPVFYLDEPAVFDFEMTSDQVRWLDGLGRASLALPPGV
ncbi:MAG: LamG-like jellyroll fold domain-containing protein [Planctomycetota bacterium]